MPHFYAAFFNNISCEKPSLKAANMTDISSGLLRFFIILHTRILTLTRMKFTLLLTFTVLIFSTSSAQDFSNKGKDFWLSYSYHVGMLNAGGQPVMTLYVT